MIDIVNLVVQEHNTISVNHKYETNIFKDYEDGLWSIPVID